MQAVYVGDDSRQENEEGRQPYCGVQLWPSVTGDFWDTCEHTSELSSWKDKEAEIFVPIPRWLRAPSWGINSLTACPCTVEACFHSQKKLAGKETQGFLVSILQHAKRYEQASTLLATYSFFMVIFSSRKNFSPRSLRIHLFCFFLWKYCHIILFLLNNCDKRQVT